MNRIATALGAGSLVLLTACGGGGGNGNDRDAGPSPARYGVGLRTETFVDPSRGTDARGNLPQRAERTLPSDVYYPTAPAPTSDPQEDAPAADRPGGFPLVVFAHGSGGNAQFYRVLLKAWAAAGYVVVAPTFPLTSTQFRNATLDVVNQPRDVSFIIDEMVHRSADPASPYAGRIDPARVAVAGHSLGGVTALSTAYNSCCRDPRVKAAIVLAGAEQDFPDGTYFGPGGPPVPLLVVHGEADQTVPVAQGEKLFNDAPPPKVMLTLPTSELPGTDHTAPYVGSNGNPVQRTFLVLTATTGFLDRYLGGQADALDALRAGVAKEIGYRLQVVER